MFLKHAIVFLLNWNWGCLPFCHSIEVVFHFAKKGGRPPFCQKLRLSSILQKIEVVFQFQTNWGRLPFDKRIRSSFNSCELTRSTFTDKCWKINFPGWGGWVGGWVGWVGWVAELKKNKAYSGFNLSLTWSWDWAWQQTNLTLWYFLRCIVSESMYQSFELSISNHPKNDTMYFTLNLFFEMPQTMQIQLKEWNVWNKETQNHHWLSMISKMYF
jgi:hypothetical protein